jgi:hypothetical protein
MCRERNTQTPQQGVPVVMTLPALEKNMNQDSKEREQQATLQRIGRKAK